MAAAGVSAPKRAGSLGPSVANASTHSDAIFADSV